MRTLKLAVFLFAVCLLSSCAKDDDLSTTDQLLLAEIEAASNGMGLAYFTLPQSEDYSAIPQDPNNPITEAKVTLGKLLFHESAFAVDGNFPITVGTYSCASCHHAAAGFQSGLAQGLGEGGDGFGIKGEARFRNALCEPELIDVQPIRSPSAMNGAYQQVTLWNGQFGATGPNDQTQAQWTAGTPKEVNHLGFEGLETQAIAGLDVHRMKYDKDLVESNGYKSAFDLAFPDIPDADRYTRVTAGLAIAAYERTLLSNEAPFQKYLKGDYSALTEEEKQGGLLFFSKAKCVDCHTGPALNKMEFHALGMKDFDPSAVFMFDADDPAKFGRFSFTQNEADRYKFKTPQLYNLKDVSFLGHGASFSSVEDVIQYKNTAVAENMEVSSGQLSNQFQPLNLTTSEIELISNFLVNGLYDPNLSRYVPESLPSGNCFPNNDAVSRIDLGCD